ncbi:MAG: hypothetical protein H7289_11445 [Mucilaginibacter sp.]|nr:hypothetical protein [Mucilaginibacter sp.]
MSCSVKSNAQIDSTTSIFIKTYTPEQLHADIDYVRDSLTKKHPNLYWYISKAKLNYKFDSLKKAITAPLTAPQFQHKMLHILSSIGDGHITLLLNSTKIPSIDMRILKGDKEYPIQQLTYKIIKDRLYVVKMVRVITLSYLVQKSFLLMGNWHRILFQLSQTNGYLMAITKLIKLGS